MIEEILSNLFTTSFYSFLFCIILTPLLMKLANIINLKNKPQKNRLSEFQIPLSGGLSVMLSFFLSFLFFFIYNGFFSRYFIFSFFSCNDWIY